MKLFDNVDSHKTRINDIWHFRKELSILDLDAEIHLDVMNFGAMIKERNKASLEDRVKTLIFLCHNLHEGLKNIKINNELLMRNHQSRLTRFEPFLEMNTSLKWIQYRHKLVDEDVVVVVEEISDTMVLIVIIHQILKKWKPHCTIRSGTILRYNKKMGSVYKINLLKTIRIIVIDMAWRDISRVHVVRPNVWLTFTKH